MNLSLIAQSTLEHLLRLSASLHKYYCVVLSPQKYKYLHLSHREGENFSIPILKSSERVAHSAHTLLGTESFPCGQMHVLQDYLKNFLMSGRHSVPGSALLYCKCGSLCLSSRLLAGKGEITMPVFFVSIIPYEQHTVLNTCTVSSPFLYAA